MRKLLRRLPRFIAVMIVWSAYSFAYEANRSTVPPSFVGTWAVPDRDGYVLNIIAYDGGTAATTWWEGKSGARGELGTWRIVKNRVILSYDSGWTDVIVPEEGGFTKKAYAPGLWVTDPPSDVTPVYRVGGEIARFVGVWEIDDPGERTSLSYVALRSNQTAESSLKPSSIGRWTVAGGVVRAQWPDGSRSTLVPTGRGFRIESSASGLSEKTPSVFRARRLGDPGAAKTESMITATR